MIWTFSNAGPGATLLVWQVLQLVSHKLDEGEIRRCAYIGWFPEESGEACMCG